MVIRQFFHRFTAAAGRMKDQTIVIRFQFFADLLDTRCGDAEHSQGNGGFISNLLFLTEINRPGNLISRITENFT